MTDDLGAPLDEDFIDAELMKLAQRPPILQLLLVLVVMTVTALIAWWLRNDMLYYFADEEPLELGPIEELAPRVAEEPNLLSGFGSNIYVHLSGLQIRESESSNNLFSQLIGAPIFVEQETRDADVDPLLRGVRERPSPFNPETTRPTYYYADDNGRFISFEDLTRRYGGLISYYSENYNFWFCSEPLSQHQMEYRLLRRDQLREAISEETGTMPTEEELEQAVDEDYTCEHAYLFQLGVAPSDHIWYLVLFIFIGLAEMGGLYYLFHWLRRRIGNVQQ